jgi:DNA polymerase-3 subunit beta
VKFSVQQSILSRHIDNAAKFLPKKDTIPILSHIVLTATDEGLEIIAGNTLTFIKSVIPSADYELEMAGSVAIPGKRMSEIIKKLSGIVTIQTEADVAIIQAGKSEFELSVLDSEEYPEFPRPNGTVVTIKGSDFKDLVSQTSYAVSTNESTPILMGVQFTQTGNRLKLTACDKHRLAQVEVDNESEEFMTVVDGSTLSELSKIMNDLDEAAISFGNSMLVKTSEFTFYSRIIDGTYPDTSRLIPRSFSTEFTVNRNELISALDRMHIIAKDSKTNLVKIKVDAKEFVIESKEQTQRARESLDVIEFNGEPKTFSVNGKFFSDAIKPMTATEVKISLNGNMEPIILSGKDEEGFGLILPYRTTAN